MSLLPDSAAFADYWRERRLCTVTTLRPDGSPHVVPMGVALDAEHGRAWAITSSGSRKARNLAGADGGLIAVCCLDGARWSTLEGRAVVSSEPALVAEAERRYAARYKVPRVNPDRVAVIIEITRALGNL